MPYVGSPVKQSFQAIPSVQRMNGTGSQTAYIMIGMLVMFKMF